MINSKETDMRTAIATDSNSGITQEQAAKLGIYVLPNPIRVIASPCLPHRRHIGKTHGNALFGDDPHAKPVGFELFIVDKICIFLL